MSSRLKIYLNIVKAVVGFSAIGIFFYRYSLFLRLSREGAPTADAMHPVLINNHGHHSYISASEYGQLTHLMTISVVLLLVVVGIAYGQRGLRT